MEETFAELFAVGGKSNSLGRANEVIDVVLSDKNRLEELYDCLFDKDAWIRMRAIDSLEKICRVHPEWLAPYVDRLQDELAPSTQPSIQWHLAEMFGEIELNDRQKHLAINWLKRVLSRPDVDWIVAANAMKTLAHFTKDRSFPKSQMVLLLKIQQNHKSNAVVKRANKLLAELSAD